MKKAIRIILCISCLGCMGCYTTPAIFSAGTYLGYNGKIVDADTGAPIEGVVVLVTWFRESFFWPTDTVDKFCDARETVTDNNGYFSIEGGGLGSNVQWTVIFKAGYEYLRFEWDALKDKSRGRGLRTEIKWERGVPVIPLKKLTKKERRRQDVPFPSEAYKKKKIPLLMKEINKQEIEFGRQPYPEEEWS